MNRVLYAEDDENIAAVVRSYFEHFAPEYTLEVVPNGRACLEKMAEGGYDVLLLDLVMPEVDGLHVLGELTMRGDPTPVVMVSGHGQNELAVRALRAGAVDCVDKSSPQFLHVVDIVRRVQAQQRSRPPLPRAAAGPRRAHRVLLLENSATVRDSIARFFRANAPQLELESCPKADAFAARVAAEPRPDVAIIGPNPTTPSPLDPLRQLHSLAPGLPAVLLTARNDGATAVAAFQLGAQDCIFQSEGYLTELVFSLGRILRRADTEQRNAELTTQLAALNSSLEAQVRARTTELQALSSRLLRIQEDERRAIARELHDQVGQMLTGLRFLLEAAASGAGNPALRLSEAITLTADLMRHVRELTQQFRPRVLDDLGLGPALEWHAQLFTRQTGIAVAIDLSLPASRLPADLETVAFRFVQEALTNVARHSGAQQANVTAASDGRQLTVEVSDRGRGFDVGAVLARRESIGLAGLRERVELAGGRCEIFAQPGAGTRLTAEIPLPPAAEGGPA
ncbi:MAG TPA: response regulator [Opitutaceae bacterium]|nr:response regulator [Opitutaceae bacterium]